MLTYRESMVANSRTAVDLVSNKNSTMTSEITGKLKSDHQDLPLDTPNSHIVLTFVIVVFAIYFLLLLWARRKDSKKSCKADVTILKDNSPRHHYAYLVGVYTGHRWNAGTTSHVGIQLVGSNLKSVSHLLLSKEKSILKRGSVNWFVIFTAEDLGPLQLIRLWHDSAGNSPSWYCDKIVVQDIQKNEVWTFLVQRWLSLVYGDCRIEFFIAPATEQEMKNWSTLLGYHTSASLQSEHLWTSVFLRQSGDHYTRVKRLTVAFSSLMLAMMLSMHFYKSNNSRMENPGILHLSRDQAVIALRVIIIALPVNIFLTTIFRKSEPQEIDEYKMHMKRDTMRNNDKSDWRFPGRSSSFCDMTFSGGTSSFQRESLNFEDKENEDSVVYWFPSCCTTVAWTFCIMTIISCAVVMIIHGFECDPVKSQMWIGTVFMAFLESFFFLEPLKAIVIAVSLACMVKKEPVERKLVSIFSVQNDTDTQNISMHEKITALKQTRAQKMYQPISSKTMKELQTKEKVQIQVMETLNDFCLLFCYILILSWITFSHVDDLAYYNSRDIQNSIIISQRFRNITSSKMFIEYINKTLIPTFDELCWYNNKEKLETSDREKCATVFIGSPRIRQIRVVADYKSGTEVMDVDTRNYGESWSTYKYKTSRQTALDEIWLYRTQWDTNTFSTTGKFANYPGGGYITSLGGSRDACVHWFTYLVRSRWFDQRTRAVFIDLILYSVNRNLFSTVTLLTEMLPTGSIHTFTKISVEQLLVSYRDLQSTLFTIVSVWLLMLFVFVVRQTIKFGNATIKSYFCCWWNLFDLTFILIGIATLVIYFLRSEYASLFLKQLKKADDNFLSFIWATFWDSVLKILIGMMVFLTSIRTWKVLQIGHYFQTLEKSLLTACSIFIALFFSLTIVLISFSCIAHILFNHLHESFLTVETTFYALLKYGVRFGDIDGRIFLNPDVCLGSTFLLLFIITIIIYFTCACPVLITVDIEKLKKQQPLFCTRYSAIEFFKEKISKFYSNGDKDAGERQKSSQSDSGGNGSHFHDKANGEKIENDKEINIHSLFAKKESNKSEKSADLQDLVTGEESYSNNPFVTSGFRLRSGADSNSSVFTSGLSVTELSDSYFKAMQLLTVNIIYPADKRVKLIHKKILTEKLQAMTIVALNFFEQSKSSVPEKFHSKFDSTLHTTEADDKFQNLEEAIGVLVNQKDMNNLNKTYRLIPEEKFDLDPCDSLCNVVQLLQQKTDKVLQILKDIDHFQGEHKQKLNELSKSVSQILTKSSCTVEPVCGDAIPYDSLDSIKLPVQSYPDVLYMSDQLFPCSDSKRQMSMSSDVKVYFSSCDNLVYMSDNSKGTYVSSTDTKSLLSHNHLNDSSVKNELYSKSLDTQTFKFDNHLTELENKMNISLPQENLNETNISALNETYIPIGEFFQDDIKLNDLKFQDLNQIYFAHSNDRRESEHRIEVEVHEHDIEKNLYFVENEREQSSEINTQKNEIPKDTDSVNKSIQIVSNVIDEDHDLSNKELGIIHLSKHLSWNDVPAQRKHKEPIESKPKSVSQIFEMKDSYSMYDETIEDSSAGDNVCIKRKHEIQTDNISRTNSEISCQILGNSTEKQCHSNSSLMNYVTSVTKDDLSKSDCLHEPQTSVSEFTTTDENVLPEYFSSQENLSRLQLLTSDIVPETLETEHQDNILFMKDDPGSDTMNHSNKTAPQTFQECFYRKQNDTGIFQRDSEPQTQMKIYKQSLAIISEEENLSNFQFHGKLMVTESQQEDHTPFISDIFVDSIHENNVNICLDSKSDNPVDPLIHDETLSSYAEDKLIHSDSHIQSEDDRTTFFMDIDYDKIYGSTDTLKHRSNECEMVYDGICIAEKSLSCFEECCVNQERILNRSFVESKDYDIFENCDGLYINSLFYTDTTENQQHTNSDPTENLNLQEPLQKHLNHPKTTGEIKELDDSEISKENADNLESIDDSDEFLRLKLHGNSARNYERDDYEKQKGEYHEDIQNFLELSVKDERLDISQNISGTLQIEDACFQNVVPLDLSSESSMQTEEYMNIYESNIPSQIICEKCRTNTHGCRDLSDIHRNNRLQLKQSPVLNSNNNTSSSSVLNRIESNTDGELKTCEFNYTFNTSSHEEGLSIVIEESEQVSDQCNIDSLEESTNQIGSVRYDFENTVVDEDKTLLGVQSSAQNSDNNDLESSQSSFNLSYLFSDDSNLSENDEIKY